MEPCFGVHDLGDMTLAVMLLSLLPKEYLDIAVAGHAPHMAASSGKMPIKAHLLLLVLQKTACASVLKLRQAHNKPDS